MPIENEEKGQFKKGQSGNPKGRPPGPSRGTTLAKWLATETRFKDPNTGKDVKGTVEDRIALGLIGKAIKGDPTAFALIMDSIHGKLGQKVELEAGEGGLEFTFNYIAPGAPRPAKEEAPKDAQG
jgi:hypothetical protein